MCRKITAFLTALLLSAVSFCAYASGSYTPDSIKNAVEGVISYKSEVTGSSTVDDLISSLGADAGSYTSDWYIIALSQFGVKIDSNKCMSSLLNSLEELYSEGLENVKVTDLQRAAYVMLACGEDISNVNGHNLLADCTYNRSHFKPLNSQGANSVAYALLLLDSKHFKVPSDAAQSRKDMIDTILEMELENGGYALFGDYADIDVTTIVLQALAPYLDRKDVRETVGRCLSILSDRQTATGAYKSFAKEACAETTAQVILALTSLNISPIDDSRFIKNGSSVLDGLFSFKKDSGGFCHFIGNKEDNMASYQSMMALVSVYRMLTGEKFFYDFTEKPEPVTVEIETNVIEKPDTKASLKNEKTTEKTNYNSNTESNINTTKNTKTENSSTSSKTKNKQKQNSKTKETTAPLSKVQNESHSQTETISNRYSSPAAKTTPKPLRSIAVFDVSILFGAYLIHFAVRMRKND